MANPSPINATPTLKTMAVGDSINLSGSTYTITALGTYTDDGGGRGHRTATLNDDNTTVITVSTKDTILSSFKAKSATAFVSVWSQSADA